MKKKPVGAGTRILRATLAEQAGKVTLAAQIHRDEILVASKGDIRNLSPAEYRTAKRNMLRALRGLPLRIGG